MGNDQEVSSDHHGLAQSWLPLVDGLDIVRLIDRDDRSDQEVSNLRENGTCILSRRNLESFLFDDEVLRKLAESNEQQDKADKLIAEKQKIIDAKTGIPQNDLKPVSGKIYNACKKILRLTDCGNNAKAFMRDTLAPLIGPEMAVYKELKQDIFETAQEPY